MIMVVMLLHEGAHWLTGKALGYDVWMKLTKSGLTEGVWQSKRDTILVSAAGPALTITFGLIGAWLSIVKQARFGYELIFVAFMQRFLANVFSAMGAYNDEARISILLGWEWWVVPLAIITPLLALTIWSSLRLRFGLLVNFLCYLTVSMAFTATVYADGEIHSGQDGRGILSPWLPESVGQ